MLTHKAATLAMTLVTLLGAGIVTEAEALLQEQDPKKIEILRNHINFAWVGGGSVLGGYVIVAIRRSISDNKVQAGKARPMTLAGMAQYFAVAVCSSLAFTPWALRRWFNGEPEECFLGAFVVALSAWAVYEVAMILLDRMKEAARKRGWVGIKDELLSGKAVVDQMVKPPATPPAMTRPQEPTA